MQGVLAPPKLQSIVRKASLALERYEDSLRRRRPVENAPRAPGPAMRKAMISLLCHRGSRPSTDWNLFSRQIQNVPSAFPCFTCGRPTRTWVMQVLLKIGSKRRMINCPRCGFIEDGPENYPFLQFRESKGTVHLRGKLPRDSWSAVLLIDPGLNEGEAPSRTWCRWPAARDGAPLEDFDVGKLWQSWPMNVTMVLIERSDLVVLTCNGRS